MNNEENDVMLPELIQKADEAIEAGFTVYIKFTCEKCGSRQTFEKSNTLFLKGKCEECGHITNIKKGGMFIMKVIKKE